MKVGTSSLGYTIIEVMIVLAVSGVMFMIAATFIGGKQARTAFNDGVNQMASDLQDTIEQVSDGKYSDIPLNCTGSGPSVNFGTGSNQQGTNSTCVFLGKIIHFTENDTHDYEVFSIAGSRLNGSSPVTDPTSAGATYVPDLTSHTSTPHALDVLQISITDRATRAAKHSYGIGFLQSMGSLDSSDASGGTLQSGSSTTDMYYVDGLDTANLNSASAAGLIKTHLRQASSVDMCVSDGMRYADIVLGDNGNQLGVSVKNNGTTKPATCP